MTSNIKFKKAKYKSGLWYVESDGKPVGSMCIGIGGWDYRHGDHNANVVVFNGPFNECKSFVKAANHRRLDALVANKREEEEIASAGVGELVEGPDGIWQVENDC